MIEGRPGLKAILRINIRFIAAFMALGYGWLCWQLASPEMWGLGIAAVICGIGGALHLIATVWQMVALIVRDRKVRDFAARGGKTRADRMAREEDLKSRGMIR